MEAWARKHVHISWTHSGKHAATYIAQIKVDDLLFEGRASGLIVKQDNLRRDATEAVVRDYLDFIDRSKGRPSSP